MELIRQCHAERIPAVPLAEHGQTPERRLGARFAPPISIGARKESPSAVSRLKAGAPGGRHAWPGPLVILALSRWMVSAVLADGSGLPMAVQAPGESNATPSAVEQFKRFISSPPVIKNLVFQQKVPMDGGARPLDGSFAFSTRFEYFQAKWQTNGYLFRQLGSPLDATNFTVFGELASWSGHRHALVESGVHLTTWDDRDPSVWGQNRSVFYTSRFMLHPLREVMNLGIMYAGIGTVRWDGNRFRAECEVDHQHLLITGALVPVEQGPPRALKIRYAFPHQTNDYVVRFGYEDVLHPTFLPTVITNFWIDAKGDGPGQEVELDEWRVLKEEIGGPALDESAFGSGSYLEGREWQTRVFTNGSMYDLQTNGALRLVYGLPYAGQFASAAPRGLQHGFYACWAGLNLTIFALMVGAKETKTAANNERNSTVCDSSSNPKRPC